MSARHPCEPGRHHERAPQPDAVQPRSSAPCLRHEPDEVGDDAHRPAMTPHDDRPARRRACHHGGHHVDRNVAHHRPRLECLHGHPADRRSDDGDDRMPGRQIGCHVDHHVEFPGDHHGGVRPNATRRSAALPNVARQGVILRSGTHWSVPRPDETHRDAAHQPGDRPSEARPSAPDEANSVGTNPTRDEENGRSA